MQENNLRRITYHSTIIFSPLILYWGLSVFVTLTAILYAMSKDTVAGRNVETFASAVQEMRNEPEILAAIDSQNEKILVNNSKTPYVIFILGEATTRNHMQLYGYNLENTPKLVERNSRGEIFKFEDVTSCANYTMSAMRQIFTFTEKDDDENLWYTKANLFDI